MKFPHSEQTKTYQLHDPLPLENGEVLEQVRVGYRTWGEPRPEATLICHALTGSADADEWWEGLFGPNRSFDPERDYIIASNVLGGCYGTTGPTTPRPGGDGWYGPDFPRITIRDMVSLQASLIDHLGVETLRLVIGGSMGGMQALEWAAMFPERVKGGVAIGVGANHSAWSVAFSEAQRAAIWADPGFQEGAYQPGEGPESGLAVARMIAMISYRGKANFETRFGRRTVEDEFEIRSYLRYQGQKLVARFDANTYLTLVDAMDSHDLARGRGEMPGVLDGIKTPFLTVGISSDILYPAAEVEELAGGLPNARYQQLHAPQGHDSFLIDMANLDGIVTRFKNDLARGITPADDFATGTGRGASWAFSQHVSSLPLHLLPETATVSPLGGLSIGARDVTELADEYGTPLFIYDEAHLRSRCREAVAAFPDGVAYATKAFLCGAIARLADEEGMLLDVATGGEIHVALASGVAAERLIFHGNNKSPNELTGALEAGVGRIVVDSVAEMDRIEALVEAGAPAPRVLIRVNPGVEAHTHAFLRTGAVDSKFGISMENGEAARAVERARSSPAMDLIGIHAHVGSQVFDVTSFEKAIEVIAGFAVPLEVEEVCIGGGLGVAYVEGEEAPSITEWGEAITAAARNSGLETRIMAEPGRAIVAQAAITVYTVGTIKEIPGVRTYLSVDGGMSDNPRPVLYGSGYEVFAPAATTAPRDRQIRLVGKHCESGDVLAWEARVPSALEVGDYLATPVTGAYGHSMGSNYNMVRRPPVVFVADGEARLVVRRETNEDLLSRDLVAGPIR